MGTLYRKFCPPCDGNAETNVTFHGFAGAAITDSRRGGEIVSDGHVAYIADSGDLISLPHPIESHALDAAGGKWTDAAIHGRLIYIHNLICADCGAQNTTASIHTGDTGCVTGLALAGVVIAWNVFVFNFHPIATIIFVWMALFAPSKLIDRYVRMRYHNNVVPHQTKRCIKCGGGKLVSLASAKKDLFPCPQCKQRTMTIEIAGLS